MRRLLYITPYFPPQSQVGAMRPLKFVRHLREHGWEPVVLCDLWPGAAMAGGLAERVPADIEVVRDYSRRARPTEIRWRNGELPRPARARKSGRVAPRLRRLVPAALTNPELLPLGEHAVHMPHALRAATRLVRSRQFDAILVNADPFAALLVGGRLARRTGLPLVADLRDPWAPCELRRPLRPAPIRALVDRMERYVVERAASVILNTETTRTAYLDHYPDVDPGRFAVLHNHGDPGLLEPAPAPEHDRFTLLFLGRLRRFVAGDGLLDVLAGLARRGLPPEAVQLLVTGDIPDATWAAAEARGVHAYLRRGDFVPYHHIGAAMAAADLLLLESHAGTQRVQAKLYDYLLAERPILALTRSPELASILARTGAGIAVDPGDPDTAVDYIAGHLQRGRKPVAPRRDSEYFTSAAATGRLAAILDRACGRA
jgi:glycosyltransferase involved in cell wall biosynthesis